MPASTSFLTATAMPAVGLLALLACNAASANVETVVGGPGNDYQATVIVPWNAPAQRIAVFERLDAGFIGDLWLTRSEDSGASWSEPVALVATAANERHASLVQTGANQFLLLHLSNASGGFRIHRASSTDGSNFTPMGPIDLGWQTAGEVNPQVSREPDGTLMLAYHRLSGPAFIARSSDAGQSWDQLRTQVSPTNAALPRIARRSSDGRSLLLYQTGSNPVSIWTKTSTNPYDWSAPPQLLVADGNNHDGWPLVLADGRYAIVWARVSGGAFQIHSSHSADGSAWTAPQLQLERPGLANIQPLGLPSAAPGLVELYWGAAQVAGNSNHDIVRLAAARVVPDLLRDGFED